MASATLASRPIAAISGSQSSSTLISTPFGSLQTEPNFDRMKTGLRHYARDRALVKETYEKTPGRLHFECPADLKARKRLLRTKDLPVLHHEPNVLQYLNVVQWVATDGDNIGKRARSDHADLTLHVEHHSGARSGALNRIHRRHAEF